jgi:flap endonuclease-1
MGVKNLFKIIKKYAPSAIEQVPTTSLAGQTVAVDASHMVHQYVRALLGSGTSPTSPSGLFTAHIMAITNKTLFYLRLGILPIYVFDGWSPKLKAETHVKRAKIREGSTDDSAKGFRLSRAMVRDIQQLLDKMGIPWIQAVGEADPQCARLTYNPFKVAYGVVSDDMDMLAFGASNLIRDLKSTKKSCTIINLKKLLKEMKMTRKDFAELCILLGSDYCPTLPGIGPVSAINIIQKGGVEKWAKKNSVPEGWLERFKSSRAIFTDSFSIHPAVTTALWETPDIDALEAMLGTYGFMDPVVKARQFELCHEAWAAKRLSSTIVQDKYEKDSETKILLDEIKSKNKKKQEKVGDTDSKKKKKLKVSNKLMDGGAGNSWTVAA